MKRTVADIEAAEPPLSYRFSYSVISEMFMACLSGAEDIDGVVDADERVVRLAPHERSGEVYIVDESLLIDVSLLQTPAEQIGFLRVDLGRNPDAETLTAVENALGVGLSALISEGEWPAHPNEITRAAISAAESISPIASNRIETQGIRIVLDSVAYFDIVGQGAGERGNELPPIIDAYVGTGGEVQRIVVRLSDLKDPTTPAVDGDGYAMVYEFDGSIFIDVPTGEMVRNLDSSELPSQPVPIPCVVEP